MQIAILGAGAWGTALAIQASRHHPTRLWARQGEQAGAMQDQRCNPKYLPQAAFPPLLQVESGSWAPWLREMELIVLAGPVSSLRPLLSSLREAPGVQAPVAWLCKGFESSSHEHPHGAWLPHEVQQQIAPDLRCGALSGPSFAQEVAANLPTALVAASAHPDVRQRLVAAFHHGAMRVYENSDIVGVEVGGAVKNVLAIATGLCDGLALGNNARAALITRGLAEMTRLGLALGAKADTFMGLSGLGDLVLTATGDLSRNRRVGLALAQGQSLSDILQDLGHVAEGVYSARTVAQRAQALGVDMPITQAVLNLLQGQLSPKQAVEQLMGRQSRSES